MRRRDRGAWPRSARRRSWGEAYPRRGFAHVDGAHAFSAERSEAVPRDGGVGYETRDVDRPARRRERAQAFDAFVEQNAGAVEVAFAPVMQADADLQDAVIQGAIRRASRAPEQFEGLVLLEELAAVELF